MTSHEIKTALNKETVWMAAEAIRQGVQLIKSAEKERQRQDDIASTGNQADYSVWQAYLKGAYAAAEVLWTLFNGYSAATMQALQAVANDKAGRDGINGSREEYFDAFVVEYEKVHGQVTLRTFL